jgi:hypothetical protein
VDAHPALPVPPPRPEASTRPLAEGLEVRQVPSSLLSPTSLILLNPQPLPPGSSPTAVYYPPNPSLYYPPGPVGGGPVRDRSPAVVGCGARPRRSGGTSGRREPAPEACMGLFSRSFPRELNVSSIFIAPESWHAHQESGPNRVLSTAPSK